MKNKELAFKGKRFQLQLEKAKQRDEKRAKERLKLLSDPDALARIERNLGIRERCKPKKEDYE